MYLALFSIFLFTLIINPFSSGLSPHDSSTLFIDDIDDFIRLGIPGSGEVDDPYIIEGLHFSSSTENLIEIRNIDAFFQIRSNLFEGLGAAITGILIFNSTRGSIINNSLSNLADGIQIIQSHSMLITQNRIDNSSNSGISLVHSNQNTISLNLISNNSIGLHVQGSLNTINNNNFTDNGGYGIELEEVSSENSIVWNNFLANTQQSGSQAFDDGPNNQFFNNYWDDLEITDTDNNGIADSSYKIDGKANNSDDQALVSVNEFDIENLDGQRKTNNKNILQKFQVPIVLLLLLAMLISFLRWLLRRIFRIRLRNLSDTALVALIGSAPAVLSNIIDVSETDPSKFEDIAPEELYIHKFILNPIRLAILTILHGADRLPSYQLREKLRVSWGSYSPHIDALENRGMIDITEEFIDGKPRKVIYLASKGRILYQELQQVFTKLFKTGYIG
ncbi:MAG: right-handed parallel beta-helix repeat-containing protein [Candidatus Kariarchaeaceae archaeon]|jgi:parallel beta-helix repeat protein